MGHSIQAFLGPRHVLERLAADDANAFVFDLTEGLAALPVLFAWLTGVRPPDGGPAIGEPFVRLTDALADRARDASQLGAITYVETDYFGGVGSQCAMLFEAGVMRSVGSINEALASLGVTSRADLDAFDTVGLGDYRDNDAFFARAGLPPPDDEF